MRSRIYILPTLFVCLHCLAEVRTVRLSEGGAPTSAAVIAEIEDFRGREIKITRQIVSDQRELSTEVKFLLSYYKHGWNGDRDGIIKLFAPQVRSEIAKQYAGRNDVRQQFASLEASHIKMSVLFGDMRLVWVDHFATKGGGPMTWVHSMRCSEGACLFAQDQEVMQVGSVVMRMALKGSERVAVGSVDGVTIKLLPRNSPASQTSPVKLTLGTTSPVEVKAATETISKFFEALTKDDDSTLIKQFFDAGVPTQVGIVSSAKGPADYQWEAFVRRVRKAPRWEVAAKWTSSQDQIVFSLVEIATRDIVSFRVRKSASRWQVVTDPDRGSDLWMLTQTAAYANAVLAKQGGGL